MEKISDMVVAQGLNVDSFQKYIESRNDLVTKKWGYFDTYCRNTLLRIGLFGDIIVSIWENSQYEMGYKVASGIGHSVYMNANNTDVSRLWTCNERISYRDQYDQYKDHLGPIPKEFVDVRSNSDRQVLEVIALMPDGTSRSYILKERAKGQSSIHKVGGDSGSNPTSS